VRERCEGDPGTLSGGEDYILSTIHDFIVDNYMPVIDPSMVPLFRDVSDHIRQVQEEIESLREVLAFALETSLMTGQSQQTEITRKLAA
jgi:Mg2+ and Co2+ transporter CorA